VGINENGVESLNAEDSDMNMEFEVHPVEEKCP